MDNYQNDARPIMFLSDVELPFEEELNEIENRLSQEEEKILREIIETEKQIEKKDFMDDLLSAVKKGAEDYIDAMTDTGDTFDHLKNSKKVNEWDDVQISRRNMPSTMEERERIVARTMKEANQTPFDNDSAHSTEGMSKEGVARFAMHKEAYKQRTKSIVALSVESDKNGKKSEISWSNPEENQKSLSGLRGYRVGIVVPMDAVSDVQAAYQKDLQEKGVIDSQSNWLRKRNFDKFDEALMKEYGFKSKSAAAKWRRENHLTIHESADGMILVPTDVHDKASHSGYCSQMSKLLKGEISKEQFEQSVVQEKIAYVQHEAKQHTIRAVKGIGLDAVKGMMKFCIATISKETYDEFHQQSEEKFVQRMKRILNNSWLKFKAKFKNEIKKIFSGDIVRSLLNEFLTMLNDYFLGVFKKIFKLVRQMWGSIKNAFKIICSKQYSWQERMFEAAKILSAGAVGVLGFSLNELLEKGLISIGFPFAPFVAECLSGLFAGIMSAVVLMLFDNMKAAYKSNNAEIQLLQKQSQLSNIYTLQIGIDTLRADNELLKAYVFVNMDIAQIMLARERVIANLRAGRIFQAELFHHMQDKIERREKFINLNKQIRDEDF